MGDGGYSAKPDFDRERLVAALETLLPRLACRLCGSQSWEPVLEEDPEIYSGLPYYRGDDAQPYGYAPAVPVACGVCGLMEFFDPTRLSKWNGGDDE